MGGKWLGLLKEVSPKVAHVGVLYHPQTAPYAASFLEPLQAGAAASSVQVQPAEVHDAFDVERVIDTLPINSSGLVIIPSTFMTGHRDLIVVGCASCGARNLSFPIFRNRGWADCIRRGWSRHTLARRVLCGSHPQGRETC
jgi:hypothetical protein